MTEVETVHDTTELELNQYILLLFSFLLFKTNEGQTAN